MLSGLAGDGTVPIDSSAGLFFGDSRVTLEPFTKGANTSHDVSHLALMWNPDVQALLLDRMGVPFDAEDISTTLHYSLAASLWASNDIVTLGALVAVLDPVEGVLVDGAGRRLGYTESGGAFTEIPGSRWIGGTDGFGFVLGPSTGPFSFVLTGLGGPHYAGASVFSGGGSGGVVDTAPLGIGEVRVLPVPIPEPAGPLASLAAAAALTALRRARRRRIPRNGLAGSASRCRSRPRCDSAAPTSDGTTRSRTVVGPGHVLQLLGRPSPRRIVPQEPLLSNAESFVSARFRYPVKIESPDLDGTAGQLVGIFNSETSRPASRRTRRALPANPATCRAPA